MAAKPPSTSELSPDGVIIEGNTPASTTVVQNNTPVTETPPAETPGSGEEFDLSAFDTAKQTVSKDELGAKKPVEATKTADEVKLTPAEADVKAKQATENKPKLPPLNQPSNKTVIPRDVSDLPEEDRPLFERMSNDAFNKLKPMYKEYGTLKAEKEANAKKLQENEALIAQLKQGLQPVPDNYYEHENAYVLTPEFNKASSELSMAEAVRNHWQSQLERVMSGEKTFTTLMRDQQGTIRVSQPMQVDAATDATLRNNLAFAFEQVGNRKAALDSVAQSFQVKAKEASSWLGQWEKGTFPIFDKPEGKELVEQAKDLVLKFPPAYRSNPLVHAFAKSLVLNNRFIAMLQSKQQTPTAAQPKKQTAKAPSLAEVNGDGGEQTNGSAAEVSIDDFENVKSGL